jgi:hypothetical protein
MVENRVLMRIIEEVAGTRKFMKSFVICTPPRLDDQIKDKKVHGRGVKCIQNFSWKS